MLCAVTMRSNACVRRRLLHHLARAKVARIVYQRQDKDVREIDERLRATGV
jgi:hypothetical protein